jgi:hypothetical protein
MEESCVKNNDKEALSCKVKFSPSPKRENNFLSVQLEVVRRNGVCTMVMAKSLMEMVAKFSSEVQLPKSDNATLKFQLRDFTSGSCMFHPYEMRLFHLLQHIMLLLKHTGKFYLQQAVTIFTSVLSGRSLHYPSLLLRLVITQQ